MHCAAVSVLAWHACLESSAAMLDLVLFLQLSCGLQGTPDEAASFCFNMLDSGRRGMVSKEDFMAAAKGCAAVALQEQATHDEQWLHAVATGRHMQIPFECESCGAYGHNQ